MECSAPAAAAYATTPIFTYIRKIKRNWVFDMTLPQQRRRRRQTSVG